MVRKNLPCPSSLSTQTILHFSWTTSESRPRSFDTIWFDLDDGRKHLFRNNFVTVRGSRYRENMMLTPQLNNTISDILGVSEFIEDRLGHVFLNG